MLYAFTMGDDDNDGDDDGMNTHDDFPHAGRTRAFFCYCFSSCAD